MHNQVCLIICRPGQAHVPLEFVGQCLVQFAEVSSAIKAAQVCVLVRENVYVCVRARVRARARVRVRVRVRVSVHVRECVRAYVH